jgi:hypothetical protein
MVVKPYQETQVTNNIKQRIFTEDTSSDDLCWHRDAEDRTVRVLKGDGWKLQLDNCLPIELTQNKEYFIPERVYHRLIKGKNNLTVEIKSHKI